MFSLGNSCSIALRSCSHHLC